MYRFLITVFLVIGLLIFGLLNGVHSSNQDSLPGRLEKIMQPCAAMQAGFLVGTFAGFTGGAVGAFFGPAVSACVVANLATTNDSVAFGGMAATGVALTSMMPWDHKFLITKIYGGLYGAYHGAHEGYSTTFSRVESIDLQAKGCGPVGAAATWTAAACAPISLLAGCICYRDVIIELIVNNLYPR